MTAVRFDAAAVTDVALARDWYDGERPGLGEEFVDAVAAATDRIGRFPSAGSLVHAGLRRHFLDRFPYVLYYARTRLAYSSSRAFTWRGGRSIRWTGSVANKRIDTDKPRPAS